MDADILCTKQNKTGQNLGDMTSFAAGLTPRLNGQPHKIQPLELLQGGETGRVIYFEV